MWSAIPKASGPVVDQQMDLGWGTSDDVIVTDVSRRGGKLTRIGNCYDQ